jgi:hypothetical protein
MPHRRQKAQPKTTPGDRAAAELGVTFEEMTMGMNPDTNEMEPLSPALTQALDDLKQKAEDVGIAKAKAQLYPGQLLRPNGEPVPEHWSTYAVGEEVIVKNYRFEVALIGEKHLLLKPVGPVLIGEGESP